MPFVSGNYIEAADYKTIEKLLAEHMSLGEHPETGDVLLVPEDERFSGIYLSGMQGVGKSALLANMIQHDAEAGNAVIVIDPHGDLVRHCIERLPTYAVCKTYLLNMEDEAYPFGVNSFSGYDVSSSLKLARAVDLQMHIFEAVWPDVLKQHYLPRYLRTAIIVLLAANPGMTLVDMQRFLLDDQFRAQLIKNVTDPTVLDFWRIQYDELSDNDRMKRVQPLLGRLELLFVGRSLVRNILGQSETSINFTKAIENKELLFITLPTQSLTQDARLIGTMLMAQTHAAVFSFADLPPEKRPGVSVYIDEFQNFVTQDIAELFTQGRKFGVKLTVAHQFRGQLPEFLRQATMTAHTKVCFKLTPDDGREMAHLFHSKHAEVRPEAVEPHPVENLLTYGSDDPNTQEFTDLYLRPLHSLKRGHTIEILRPGFRIEHVPLRMLNIQPPTDHPKVSDPTPFLNHLLYEVMKAGVDDFHIPPVIVYGFSNCGRGFYPTFRYTLDKAALLSPAVKFPPELVVEAPDGSLRWTRVPENGGEQLWHFLFTLRMTMAYLAENPIGERTTPTTSEVAQMLTELPHRAAFVHTGDDVGVIYTSDTPPAVPADELQERLEAIQKQTRDKYCTPKAEVEARLLKPIEQDTNTSVDTPTPRWEEL
jgi:hypothetical protein